MVILLFKVVPEQNARVCPRHEKAVTGPYGKDYMVCLGVFLVFFLDHMF